MHLPVPALLLQPLIENSIYHGIEQMPQGGTVSIRGTHADGMVCIDIRNPRPPPGARRGGGNGVALANTRSRIEYHFERGGGLDTEAGVDYFICSVRLPCPGATARPKPAGAQKELIAEAETVHESPDR